MWTWLQSIFSKNDYSAQPEIIIGDCCIEEPSVTIVVGKKRLHVSGQQARSIWGKLGKNLEMLTPNKKKTDG